jgi:hypothetical protein
VDNGEIDAYMTVEGCPECEGSTEEDVIVHGSTGPRDDFGAVNFAGTEDTGVDPGL